MNALYALKRILALSKDHGSLQAISPVVAALKTKSHTVRILAPKSRHDVATMLGLVCDTFDESEFLVAPHAYIAKVFDDKLLDY